MNSAKARIIFILLVVSFLCYSVYLYIKPEQPVRFVYNRSVAAQGRLVWQKYNCQSCHQLYGLGGYLGPDLTNIYSALYKGEDYIKAFVIGGTNQMPAFSLNDSEMVQLIEFLKMTDASGQADPKLFTIQKDGMIHPIAK